MKHNRDEQQLSDESISLEDSTGSVNVKGSDDENSQDAPPPLSEPNVEQVAQEVEMTPLSKSSRLKGYITMAVISSLAFVSAYESDRIHTVKRNFDLSTSIPSFIRDDVVASSPRRRNHAMAWSGISAIFNFIIVAIHLLDSIIQIKRTRKMFQPKSEIECFFISLNIAWWAIGTWIFTSAHGIAGVGRGQFNLYFSTWLCCIIAIAMLEKWLTAANYASVYQAVKSWPHRAPGWIFVLIFTLCNLLSVLDLYLCYRNVEVMPDYLKQKYGNIQTAQWVFVIFTCGLSLTMAVGFSLAELFRREEYYIRQGHDTSRLRSSSNFNYSSRRRVNLKSTFELSLEGICLALLVLLWVPLVVIATTDGCCSEVGNSYFFTWASAYAIIQTFITWLQDWRKGVHELLLRQDREYREAQANVNFMDDNDIDDDESLELDQDNDENMSADSKIILPNDLVIDDL